MADRESTTAAFSARVTPAQIDEALRLTIKAASREGHVSYAHPTGQRFEYRPEVCAECRVRVLEALYAREVLYV